MKSTYGEDFFALFLDRFASSFSAPFSSNHVRSVSASHPDSSAAIASAFRLAERRSFEFISVSASSDASAFRSFLAAPRRAREESFSPPDDEEEVFRGMSSPFSPPPFSSYHFRSVSTSQPDSSAAMASAFLFAERRSFEFMLSFDSKSERAAKSFLAAFPRRVASSVSPPGVASSDGGAFCPTTPSSTTVSFVSTSGVGTS
mmetsp:Transcript_49354/g.148608  ORF Transcript_49354/g.148608 Transcript_49354/m.148608 type:complete len:202 (-) Transcript_49354:108-713(-)